MNHCSNLCFLLCFHIGWYLVTLVIVAHLNSWLLASHLVDFLWQDIPLIWNMYKPFQRHCSLADAFSNNCTKELKKVIMDSLVRQILLPNTPLLESIQSQHSLLQTQAILMRFRNNFKEGKWPNLIAQLMALEEVP